MLGMKFKKNICDYEIYKSNFYRKYIDYSRKYSIFRLDEVKNYVDMVMKIECDGNLKRKVKKMG